MLGLFVLLILYIPINFVSLLLGSVILIFNSLTFDFKQIHVHCNYSNIYVSQCVNEFNLSKNHSFLIYKQSNNRWDYNYNDLALFTSRIRNVSSGINIAVDFDTLVPNRQLSPFGEWCKCNTIPINEKSLLRYMKNKQIDYIFISKTDKIPFKIDSNFMIITQDNLSNEALLKRLR